MPRSTATAQPAPADVRLMNAVASTVFVLAGVGAAAAGVLWLMRSPLFPIRSIELDGDLARNNVLTIRANAAPRLVGNFFSVDLQAGREAFESVPWVRQAVLRRVWPDRLTVRLEEHRAAALWQGEADAVGAAGDKVVNSHGEVFEANLGDIEDDDLPVLAGPAGTAAQMLALHGRLQAVLQPLAVAVDRLELSGRGSWRAELDSGAALVLGRGSEEELLARARRFVRSYPQVHARWQQPLEYADLRHADGYAVRLRGVDTRQTTTTTRTPAARPAAARTH